MRLAILRKKILNISREMKRSLTIGNVMKPMKKMAETREANRRESINDSIVLMKISLKMCNMSENNNES
jgi:hypothetical protein